MAYGKRFAVLHFNDDKNKCIQDTAEKVLERLSMSHGSWAAELKRKPLDVRMQEESVLNSGATLLAPLQAAPAEG